MPWTRLKAYVSRVTRLHRRGSVPLWRATYDALARTKCPFCRSPRRKTPRMVDSLVGNPAPLRALCRRETSAHLSLLAWRRMAAFRHSGHCGSLDQLAMVRFRPAVRDRIFRRGVSIDVSFPDLQRGPALACGALVTVAARAETPQSAIHLASGLLMDRAGQRMGIRSRNPSRKPLSGKSCVRNKGVMIHETAKNPVSGRASRPLRRESALSRIGGPFYRVSHAFGLAAAVRRFLAFLLYALAALPIFGSGRAALPA